MPVTELTRIVYGQPGPASVLPTYPALLEGGNRLPPLDQWSGPYGVIALNTVLHTVLQRRHWPDYFIIRGGCRLFNGDGRIIREQPIRRPRNYS